MFGLAVVAALAYGFWRWKKNLILGLWTPEKSALYRTAMRFERNPLQLHRHADFFLREGFPDRARNLRARAALASEGFASPHDAAILEKMDLRNQIMRRALVSQNPVAIEEVAASFEGEGCGASAEFLRDVSYGLEVAQRIQPAPPGAAFGIGTIIPSVYKPPVKMVQAVDENGQPKVDDQGNPIMIPAPPANASGAFGDERDSAALYPGEPYGHGVPAGG